jgi:hypothetical protein
MKSEPRRAPPPEEVAHKEDTTMEFEPGAARAGHRRTTVTIERETLSFLIRRPAVETVTTPVARSPDRQTAAPAPPDENPPAPSPETQRELSEGKL